jgi:ribose/xylose/arabinose/galactoside ABC-type transport system permease subunit
MIQEKLSTIVSNNRKFLPLLSTVALFFVAYGFGMAFSEGMRDPQVFFNLFRNSPFILISAIGMTLVILTGGIDLSVSGVMALTTVAAAALIREGWNVWAVILLMLGMGMALGAIMGSFIAYLKVQPFIATLAGMWFARGMSFFISDDAISINNRTYLILARTKLLIPGLADPVTKQGEFISISVAVAILVLIVAFYIAHYTRFGRTIYAIGGNEHSARLMGLPVERTKILVYTINGFCSALAGITLSIFLSSGHGLYAGGFELVIIAAVVIGGTMLSGGSGYVVGTLFGVLITVLIQTLIQFNGKLSSWWTSIVIGILTLVFIGVQSVLAAQKTRHMVGSPEAIAASRRRLTLKRNQQLLIYGGGAVAVILVAVLFINFALPGITSSGAAQVACTAKPYRHDEQVEDLVSDGAVIVYERNGGPDCIDELYAVYPDGRITGDNTVTTIEKQVTPVDVEQLLTRIADKGWFTNAMFSAWHEPCRQCHGYFITVAYQGETKTVMGVEGGADVSADFHHVVAFIKAFVPGFENALE